MTRVKVKNSAQLKYSNYSPPFGRSVVPSLPCRILGLAALLTCLFRSGLQTASAQSGGAYAITKSTIDGGGSSQASGGAYVMSGTVGQPDAGPIAGGAYAMTGGFWSPAQSATTPDPITPDPSGLGKTRFISFLLPVTGTGETAVRVRLASLHHVVPPYTGGPSVPFTSFEGQVRWVGPPGEYLESNSSGTLFYSSQLQCTPHYRDWSTVGLLHVTGSAIVPSSIYEVENVAASCMGAEASCAAVSAPLSVVTTRWGDVETPYNPPSASTQPDLGDVSALVNKFRSAPGAPIKARALLVGIDGIGTIDIATEFSFIHIAACVDAFRGRPYPHSVASCP